MEEVTGGGDGRLADAVGQVNGGADISGSVAMAGKDLFVDSGVEIGKTLGEFELGAIDSDGAVGGLTTGLEFEGEIVIINGEKPADFRFFKLQKASHAVGIAEKDLDITHSTKEPLEEVKEMDANIGGNATRFFDIALPGGMVPTAARGDVGEYNIVLCGCGCVQ